jgi:hypothetical protein
VVGIYRGLFKGTIPVFLLPFFFHSCSYALQAVEVAQNGAKSDELVRNVGWGERDVGEESSHVLMRYASICLELLRKTTAIKIRTADFSLRSPTAGSDRLFEPHNYVSIYAEVHLKLIQRR